MVATADRDLDAQRLLATRDHSAVAPPCAASATISCRSTLSKVSEQDAICQFLMGIYWLGSTGVR